MEAGTRDRATTGAAARAAAVCGLAAVVVAGAAAGFARPADLGSSIVTAGGPAPPAAPAELPNPDWVPDESIRLRAIAERTPGRPGGWAALALHYERISDWDSAAAAWRRAVESDPGHAYRRRRWLDGLASAGRLADLMAVGVPDPSAAPVDFAEFLCRWTRTRSRSKERMDAADLRVLAAQARCFGRVPLRRPPLVHFRPGAGFISGLPPQVKLRAKDGWGEDRAGRVVFLGLDEPALRARTVFEILVRDGLRERFGDVDCAGAGSSVPGMVVRDRDAELVRACVVEGAVLLASYSRVASAWEHLQRGDVGRVRLRRSFVEAVRFQALAADPEVAWQEANVSYLDWLQYTAAQTCGASFVADVHFTDGASRVDELWRAPPRSTEQVLHPARWFLFQDSPSAFALREAPAVPGWTLEGAEVLGEVLVFGLLREGGVAFREARSAAEGWDGDLLLRFRNDGGGTATALLTTWDSETDAGEFDRAWASIAPAGGAPSQRLLLGRESVVVRGLPASDAERLLRFFGEALGSADGGGAVRRAD